MSYLIVIVRHGSDENLIFSAVRTWVQDVPIKVYIHGGEKNYGFKYAMLERASNLEFTDQINLNDEDYLVVLRPGQYLTYNKLSEGHSQIFDRETYLRLGIDNLLKSNLRGENAGPIMSLGTANGMLNYHRYKDNWNIYTFLSKFNQVVIPNFPVYATSIRVTNYSDLPSLITTLINEHPMMRTLVLPHPSAIDDLLTKIGYRVQYGNIMTEVLISDVYQEGYKAVVLHNRCTSQISNEYSHVFASGWSVITKKTFRQRRVDLPGYFNETDMLKFRIKELYDDFDLFIIGQMDTPYSSNALIEQGYPEISDPDNKVKLLTLSYPDEIKALNNAWIKDKYYRQYSIYHPLITDYDLLFVLDLDEIPDVNTVNTECVLYVKDVKRLEMSLHYYNLKWVKRNSWYHGYYGHVNEIRKYGADNVRVTPQIQYPVIKKGGWHISYFLTPDMIKKKIESFAHQEFNKPPYTDVDHISKCIEGGLDLFGRDYENMIPANKDYVPRYYKMLPEFTWS